MFIYELSSMSKLYIVSFTFILWNSSEAGTWTKVESAGIGPSLRFSVAGDSLDPQKSGVLVFLGGCSRNLDALEDMYFLHTGIVSSYHLFL